MELRVLKYFLTVCNQGSITAAAEALNITQPALSRQLMELEKEIGQTLFIRGSRRITLTEAGEYLQKRAQEMLMLSDRILSNMPKADGSISLNLCIGAGESKALPLIIQAAQSLQRKYPGIYIRFLNSNDRNTLSNQLDTGTLDFAICSVIPHTKKCSHLKLPVCDTWGLLVRKDSSLASKTAISPSDLKELALIMGQSENFRSLLSGWLGFDFGELNVVGSASLSGNTKCLVEEGFACAFIKKDFPPASGKLCFKKLNPEIITNLYLVWENSGINTKAKKLFLKELKNIIP